MAIIKWFSSRTVRQAVYFRRQVRRVLNEQRDQLSPEAISAVSAAIEKLTETIDRTWEKKQIEAQVGNLESVATKWLKPYPYPVVRENVKEVLVALTVILSITTFFIQLTKIPTGSMQPTLYGITYYDLKGEPDQEMPGRLRQFARYWLRGVSHHFVVAQAEGVLTDKTPVRTVLPFVKKQQFKIGGVTHTIWFPTEDLLDKAGVREGQYYRKNEVVLKMLVVAGDHLLVDRFTYNFRRPERGEIIVFKTKQIRDLPQGQLYIKRLVAKEGERVQIGNDNHLIIDGRRLTAATPHFENVYTFDPYPQQGAYFGHVNDAVAAKYRLGGLARHFQDEDDVFVVPENQYLAMGDNTLSSSDSRTWGGLPQENVTGKAWFVYWPITRRFGWVAH